jgi:hypothetical protein
MTSPGVPVIGFSRVTDSGRKVRGDALCSRMPISNASRRLRVYWSETRSSAGGFPNGLPASGGRCG